MGSGTINGKLIFRTMHMDIAFGISGTIVSPEKVKLSAAGFPVRTFEKRSFDAVLRCALEANQYKNQKTK